MPGSNREKLKEAIAELHEGDEKQLEVIFSEKSRLIVEAPAGYGKTKTMVSRIAFLYATGRIPNPKKALGLTFSVNAALKVKRDVANQLPVLIGGENNPIRISNQIHVTNYHGFCKGLLKKYGFLISPFLKKDINTFKAIGDNDIKETRILTTNLSDSDKRTIDYIEKIVKSGGMPDKQEYELYNRIIQTKLLPYEFITYNAEILFTIELLDHYSEVRRFYQNFYPLVIVDEFQDTNGISWNLLRMLISEKSNLLFLGDPLQRIYGFIGALPDIMEKAEAELSMTKITLDKNYRFRTNQDMLQLDSNIRKNAETNFDYTAQLPLANVFAFWGSDQRMECEQVAEAVANIVNYDNDRVALLFRGRNENENIMEDALQRHGIEYFYGMFTDEDPMYVDFHNYCLTTFIETFGRHANINSRSLKRFVTNVRNHYQNIPGKEIKSLIELLEALEIKLSTEYATIDPDEKYLLLVDIFENRQLKQAMEYIDAQVIISTIHGAKGLEWDYVFLPDVERWIFPGYYTCNNCVSRNQKMEKCKCVMPSDVNKDNNLNKALLEELSVLYVGITRARKQVFLSASGKRIAKNSRVLDSGFSCFSQLNGMNLVSAKKED